MSTVACSDLAVVGAGIVGLAHAVQAVRRGLSVTVLERNERAVGASVRNFGHGCFTAQTGIALERAWKARELWLDLAADAGFWVGRAGTVVVARSSDECEVLAQFAAERGDGQVRLLDAGETARRASVGTDGLHGGAHFPLDLRIDARTAVPALTAWLAAQPGVRFEWSTNVVGIEDGVVETARGPRHATAVVACLGHDVDRLFPDLADAARLRRCQLHMLRVAAPGGCTIAPAVLTGLSLLRYAGLVAQPAAEAVARRFAAEQPELLAAEVNLMLTQRPDGDLLVGDTHRHERTTDPFRDEALDDLVLAEAARLLGVDRLHVLERWQGVYASGPGDFLVAAPHPTARVVSVTSGIGMTTALGLAPDVLDDLLDGRS